MFEKPKLAISCFLGGSVGFAIYLVLVYFTDLEFSWVGIIGQII